MRRAPLAVLALAALLGALTLARLPAAWASGNALNHVSGAWMTLADDLAHGTFYRPLADGVATGGTRFFPLAFVLQAGLLRLGAPLLAAGYALSLAAGLGLVLAAFRLLRAAGLARAPAAAFAALALGGFAGQHALSAIRCDLLAVALEAAGLGAVLRAVRRETAGAPDAGPAADAAARRTLAAAAILFGLAFATKPTALTAPAAAAAFLATTGQRRHALALAAVAGTLATAVVASTELLSAGRFLELLRTCAAGGAGPGDVVRAPLRLVVRLAYEDRSGAALAGAAALAARAAAPRSRAGWAAPDAAGLLLALLWLAASAVGAIVVFASPGTGVNHLLELEAASAVTLGAAVARLAGAPGADRPRLACAARAGAAAAAVVGVVLAASMWRADLRGGRLADLRATLEAAPPGAMLAEDPLVPLLAGERAAVLDPWMLRLASARDARTAQPLAAALRRGDFPAVVLLEDLADARAEAWYSGAHLGPIVIGAVRERYRRVARFGRYVVYAPAWPTSRGVRLAGPALVGPGGGGREALEAR